MHMSRRSMSVVALMSVAAMGLTACSGSGAKTDSTASSSASADKGATITYLHRLPDGEGMTKISTLAEQWNKEHPDTQVQAVKFDGKANEMIKKLETDVKAGSGPCLAQIGYGELPEMFTKGLLEDVTEYANQYKTNYSAGAFSQVGVGGKYFGLPQDTGPLVYYYNKAEFDKLGIKVPTNLDEFKAAAKTAAAKGKYISAFETDEAQYGLSAQAAAAGGVWYKAANDKWTVKIDDASAKTVADFWQSMLDDKTTFVTERWGDSFTKALTDKTLIGTIGAAWEAPLISGDLAKTDNKGEWAVAQLPDFGKGALTGPDGGSGVAVMKGCANPKGAMEFNNWLNTQVDALVSQGLVVATTTGTMKTPDSIKEFYGGQDVFAELSKANANLAPDFPYIPFFSSVGAPMTKAATAAGDGSGKVIDIFKAAQEQSVKSLKDGNLPVAE